MAARVAAIHLAVSIAIFFVTAYVVFGLWYPYPYRKLAGGTELFLILALVDVVCGPLLTLIIYDKRKSLRELIIDFSFIAMIQLAALLYGVHAIFLARPIYLVYEVDRFRVVASADLQNSIVPGASKVPSPSYWSGPSLIGVRDPKDSKEKLESLDLSLRGIEPSARPDWWVPYSEVSQKVLARSKPVSELRNLRPTRKLEIDEAVKASGMGESEIRWVPLTGLKSTSWVIFLDASTAEIKSFAPVDGFE